MSKVTITERLRDAWRKGLETSPLLLALSRAAVRMEAFGNRMEARLPSFRDPAFGSRIPLPAVGFLIAVALLFSRGFHLLHQPDFYIEDGREFYQNAHNLGLASIWRVYAGYFHLFPRIAALLAQLWPLKDGPMVLGVFAILLQATTGAYLLSQRLATQFPSLWSRVFLAMLVVGYPNADELFANVAHSQWFLAVLAAAIICAEPTHNLFVRTAEFVVILLAAATGPFVVVLAPIALVRALQTRRSAPHAAVLCLGAVLTLASIISFHRMGGHAAHRLPLIFRMLSNQVALGATEGYRGLKTMEYEPYFNLRDFVLFLIVVGLVYLAIRRGPALPRSVAILGLFSWLAVLASEASWLILGSAGVGERYFYFLGFVFVASSLFVLTKNSRSLVRWGGRLIATASVLGMAWNWIYPEPYKRFDYQSQVAAYGSLPIGATLHVKTSIDRRSDASWVMDLVKTH